MQPWCGAGQRAGPHSGVCVHTYMSTEGWNPWPTWTKGSVMGCRDHSQALQTVKPCLTPHFLTLGLHGVLSTKGAPESRHPKKIPPGRPAPTSPPSLLSLLGVKPSGVGACWIPSTGLPGKQGARFFKPYFCRLSPCRFQGMWGVLFVQSCHPGEEQRGRGLRRGQTLFLPGYRPFISCLCLAFA